VSRAIASHDPARTIASPSPLALAAAHQPADSSHHLGGPRVLLLRLGADDTRVGVAVEEAQGDLVERGLDMGGAYYFCSSGCREAFESEPEKYASGSLVLASAGQLSEG